MSEQPHTGKRQRILIALGQLIARRATWIVVTAVVLAGASVAYTLHQLEFITDRNALVDPEAEYNQRFLRFTEAFGDQELMLVMIGPGEGPARNPDYNPDIPDEQTRQRMKSAATEIATAFRQHPDKFPLVIDRVDPDGFGGTRMLYLPEKDLETIAQQIESGKPLIQAVANEPTFPSMLTGMRTGIDQGAVDEIPDDESLNRGGAELAGLIGNIRQTLEAEPGAPPVQGLFEFTPSDPGMDPDGYFFMWEGRLLFLPMLPAKDQGALNQIEEPLVTAREVVAEVQENYPDLAIGLTGRPVIYSDEMEASGRDMTFATIFAVIAVGLMFIIAFRSFLRPMTAVFSLVLALCWTIGATTLFIGHLNIFAMVFGVVLVGLGIDFGIHLLSHYRHGLQRGYSVRETLTEVYAEIGMGTVLGAVTTAAALSTAAFTDFLGLAELGIICGIGILFCLIAMLVVFPALLVVIDKKRIGEGNPVLRDVMRQKEEETPRLARGPARSKVSRYAALAVVILTLASVGFASYRLSTGWVPFTYNLLELNDPSAEGVHWERLLIDHDQRASYAVSTRHSLDELVEIREQYETLEEKGLIKSTESMLPTAEPGKRETLARIHAALPDEFADVPQQPSTATELRSAARRLQAALTQLTSRGERFDIAFSPALEEVQRLISLTRDRSEHVDTRLAETEPEFFANLVLLLRELKKDSDPPPVTPDTLPPQLRSRYVGEDEEGKTLYALYVYPTKNVWERDIAEEFNTAIREVDPQATGVTIQIFESGELIVAGFGTSVLYAFIAIVALLFLDLRRPMAVLVALLPLFCALAILLGAMSVTDLSFNFANFFGVPILIGITVDAGVYLVHSQRHGDPRRTLRQTRHACLLCGMTTMLGFGSLITASHLGVVSLGYVLLIGCAAGILASFFVVPVVLAWFHERNQRL